MPDLPERFGLDEQKLPRVIDRYAAIIDAVDWFDPNAEGTARDQLQSLVEENAFYWQRRARRFPIPFVVVVRNVCAIANEIDAAALRLLLRWLATSTPDISTPLEEIAASLPPGGSVPHVVAEELLFSGAPLRSRTLTRLRARQLKARGLQALREGRLSVSSLGSYLLRGNLVRDRREIIAALLQAFEDGTPETVDVASLPTLEKRLVDAGLEALYATLLPVSDRAPWLLRLDGKRISRVLPQLPKIVLDEAVRATAQPEWRGALIAAIPDSERRRQLIGLWIQDRAAQFLEADLSSIFENGLGADFLPFAPTMRNQMIESLEAPALRPLVTDALAAGTTAAATVAAFSDEFLERFFRERPDAAERLANGIIPGRGGVRPRHYTSRLLQLVLAGSPGAYIRARQGELEPLTATLIVNRILAGETLDLSEVQRRRLLGDAWRRAMAAADLGMAFRILAYAAHANLLADPTALDFRLVLPKHAYALLTMAAEAHADVVPHLLERTPWVVGLRSAAKARTAVPPTVVRAIEAAGGMHLRAAADAHPWVFARAVVRANTPTDLLELALKHPAIGRCVEAAMSRAEIQALLPRARAIAANVIEQIANEVAVAFSLADARFIRALAHRAAAQYREDEGSVRRGRHFDDLYNVYTLPKKSGGKRTITAPEARLKRLQRRIVENGFRAVELPDAVHGFRAGRSIASNAAPHVGSAMVVNVDIDDFFPTTTFRLIVGACRRLETLGLSREAALFVAELCSYNGALPTGAPTSPYIANIVLAGVDKSLSAVSAGRGWNYTRYADDLTFSGDDDVRRIIPFVRRLLGERGYQLDPEKTNIFRRGRRQMVTGLVVNVRPNLPRTIRRRLRAAVHKSVSGGELTWHDRPMTEAALRGRLAVLRMVDPQAADRHFSRLGWVTASSDGQ